MIWYLGHRYQMLKHHSKSEVGLHQVAIQMPVSLAILPNIISLSISGVALQ